MSEIDQPSPNDIIDEWCNNYGVVLPGIIREKWIEHLENSEIKHRDPPDDIFMDLYSSYSSDEPSIKKKPANTIDGILLFVSEDLVEKFNEIIADQIADRGPSKK